MLPTSAGGRSFSSQSHLLSNRLLLLPKIGPVCAPRLCKLRSSSPFAVGMENQTLNLPRYFIFLPLVLWIAFCGRVVVLVARNFFCVVAVVVCKLNFP